MIEGKVVNPTDLTPAIEELGPVGRDRLLELAAGRKVEPWMVAQAADYEREYNGKSSPV